jgi:hypothetical protein
MSQNSPKQLDSQIRYWLKDIKPKEKKQKNKTKFRKPNRR